MIVDTTLTIGDIVVTGEPVAIGESGYELLAMGFQTIQRRRDVATSPWVHGDTEVASVQGALTYGFTLNTVGADGSLWQANVLAAQLITQLQQNEWDLIEQIEEGTQTYNCRAAISIEAPYDRNNYINARRQVTATIPVKRA